MLNEIVGIIGTILGAVGVMLTIRSEVKNKKIRTISWEDIHSATKHFWRRLKQDKFLPDIVITPGQKGGIIAQMIIDFYDANIPIFTGFLEPAGQSQVDVNDYIYFSTSKWNIFLPIAIDRQKNKEACHVLIVDDYTMTGDFLQTIKKKLQELGYNLENIKICTIVVTKVAIDANKAPDYHWKVVNDNDFFFPWGKAK